MEAPNTYNREYIRRSRTRSRGGGRDEYLSKGRSRSRRADYREYEGEGRPNYERGGDSYKRPRPEFESSEYERRESRYPARGRSISR
jgi:hypothetical protein